MLMCAHVCACFCLCVRLRVIYLCKYILAYHARVPLILHIGTANEMVSARRPRLGSKRAPRRVTLITSVIVC